MKNVNEVIAVLEETKAYIKEHGWIQHKLWNEEDPKGPVCLLGALCKVTNSKPDKNLDVIKEFAGVAKKAAIALSIPIEGEFSYRRYLKQINNIDKKIKNKPTNFECKKSYLYRERKAWIQELLPILKPNREDINSSIADFNDNQNDKRTILSAIDRAIGYIEKDPFLIDDNFVETLKMKLKER